MTPDNPQTEIVNDVDPLFLGLTRPAMFWGLITRFLA